MANDVVVIDYGVGNVRSVMKAFESLGASTQISNEPQTIRSAERLVLPGVGAFDAGIKNLERTGIDDLLQTEVMERGKPFLAICLGMQVLATEGFENGRFSGLNWIKGKVQKLSPTPSTLRIPHVGW